MRVAHLLRRTAFIVTDMVGIVVALRPVPVRRAKTFGQHHHHDLPPMLVDKWDLAPRTYGFVGVIVNQMAFAGRRAAPSLGRTGAAVATLNRAPAACCCSPGKKLLAQRHLAASTPGLRDYIREDGAAAATPRCGTPAIMIFTFNVMFGAAVRRRRSATGLGMGELASV